MMNVTRERIRQIDAKVLAKVRRRKELDDWREERAGGEIKGTVDAGKHQPNPVVEPASEPDEPEPAGCPEWLEDGGDEAWAARVNDAYGRRLASAVPWSAIQRRRELLAEGRRIDDEEPTDMFVGSPSAKEEEQEDDDMAKPKSALRLAIEAAHPMLMKKLGHAPTAEDLFIEIGSDVAKNMPNLRMAVKRTGLEIRGMRASPKKAAVEATKVRRAAATMLPPRTSPRQAATVTVTVDPVEAIIRAELDGLDERATKLRAALALLQGAA